MATTTTRLSQSPYLLITANVFATIFLGLGINGIIRPHSALSVLEFSPPTSPSDKQMVDSLMMLFSAKELFMSAAIYSAAYFGDRRVLGCLLIATGGAAGIDGWVCGRQVGGGEWNHWGYGIVGAGVGGLLLGVGDR